jgi:hypothetical protein
MSSTESTASKAKLQVQANHRAVLARVRKALAALGFTSKTPSTYTTSISGQLCNVGVSKLTLMPTMRIYCSVGEDRTAVLVSDSFQYRGNPSGRKFNFSLSRLEDNSEACASEIVAFVEQVAVPWFNERMLGQRPAREA